MSCVTIFIAADKYTNRAASSNNETKQITRCLRHPPSLQLRGRFRGLSAACTSIVAVDDKQAKSRVTTTLPTYRQDCRPRKKKRPREIGPASELPAGGATESGPSLGVVTGSQTDHLLHWSGKKQIGYHVGKISLQHSHLFSVPLQWKLLTDRASGESTKCLNKYCAAC
eukprot:3610373-Amphidinium_carterae.1